MTRYLSIKQVASVLGVCDKTIYNMVDRGQIPGHFRLGSLHLIDEEVFNATLKQLSRTLPKQNKPKGRNDPHGLL